MGVTIYRWYKTVLWFLPYIFFLLCLFLLILFPNWAIILGIRWFSEVPKPARESTRRLPHIHTHAQLLKEKKQSHRIISLNHYHCHTHSLPTRVPPSNSLPCWLAETNQTCCILSCRDTKLPSGFWFWIVTWYAINRRFVDNATIWWQNDCVTLCRFLWEVRISTWLPPDQAERKSDSGWVFG